MRGRGLTPGPSKHKNVLQKLLYNKRLVAEPNVSKERPTVGSILLQAHKKDFHDVVATAVASGALERDSLLVVLNRLRKFHWYDKADALVRACAKSGLQLGKRHTAVVMACATDCGEWREAVRHYHEFCSTGGHTNSHLRNTLMAAYSRGGQWRRTLQVYAAMVESKMADSVSMHIAMRNARLHRSWSAAIQCFSSNLQVPRDSDIAIGSLTYLELLRCLEAAALAGMPTAWWYSLSILSALEPVGKCATGHYNAVLATVMASARSPARRCRWDLAIDVLSHMVQRHDEGLATGTDAPDAAAAVDVVARRAATAAYIAAPNAATLDVVLGKGPVFPLQVVLKLFAVAQLQGLRVSAAAYRQVFRSFFHSSTVEGCDGSTIGAGDVTHFIEKIMHDCINDPGNSNVSVRELFTGLLDALLVAPDPSMAQHLLGSYEDHLAPIVAEATEGLGSIGQGHERWIVEGRVAVLTALPLQSESFPSLLDRYDTVLVPFSVVRQTVIGLKDSAPGAAAAGRKTGCENLRKYAGKSLRVVPLLHQLHAHNHFLCGAIETPTAVKDRRVLQLQQTLQQEKVEGAAAGPSQVVIRSGAAMRMPRGKALDEAVLEQEKRAQRAFAVDSGRNRLPWGSDEICCVAVAAMLKKLNPDADVHVIASSDKSTRLAQECDVTLIPFARRSSMSSLAPTRAELQTALRRGAPPVVALQSTELASRSQRPTKRGGASESPAAAAASTLPFLSPA